MNATDLFYHTEVSLTRFIFYFAIQILFLDPLDVRGMEIPDGTPRVSAWDRKLMDKVIEMDMKNNGSFGKCFVSSSLGVFPL